ncbi:hypothetical protein J2Z31_001728 [Sinorhizobium kostiense]|uniref:Uncharacterized protein n=1 Tax=Sinorhizobium kostiense TaxID=76747 RepID=A0ABS4QX61_9HYPH|nr:hypothetical protein [Sinorhizobium kostiense]MBP2235236.1 hypothetical protein [Sinorhizobium kostiense]
MTNLTVQLLAEMIDESYRPTPIRQLPAKKRKQYQADAVRSTRSKVEAALEVGTVLPTRQHIRDALTDAALHILRSGDDEAEVIRQVFASVFGDEADIAIEKITAGKIEPRFFKSA